MNRASNDFFFQQRLSVADAQWTERPFDGVAAYAQTKRMQVVLVETLARGLAADGVVVHAMHPGWADTPAVRASLPRFHAVTRLILRTPEQGADTVLWLAASAAGGRSSGCFWFDRAPRATPTC